MLATPSTSAGQHTSELFLTVAYGAAIYYGIQKLFKDLEEKLSDDTRLSIAVWLLDAKVERLIEPWPRTVARVFDQVFGKRHISWQCFKRSCLASLVAVTAVAVYVGTGILAHWPTAQPVAGQGQAHSDVTTTAFLIVGLFAALTVSFFFGNVIPDFISLLETRFILHRMQLTASVPMQALLLGVDFVITAGLASVAVYMGLLFFALIAYLPSAVARDPIIRGVLQMLGTLFFVVAYVFNRYLWFYPAFLTSIWTWLYVVSGLLVRTARKLDFVLATSNRFMDVEHQPLQSIGLVAATICTLLYWVVSFISR
jgi:hypothetical protein